MSIQNKQNINVSTINVLKDINNSSGNITINNTIKIPYTPCLTINTIDNSNACLYIKDINSIGSFYAINVNSLENSIPSLYFNNNLVIDSFNLLSELEEKLVTYTLDTSNIIVTGGYINFINNINNTQGCNGVGIRYSSNNTVQFKNFNTNWIDLVDIIHYDEFKELTDVDVSTNTLLNKQYITYNATSNLFVNSNLSIADDKNPILSNNLYASNNTINFSSNINNIIYDNLTIQNPYISLINNTTSTGNCNYLSITNASSDNEPSLLCSGCDANIGLIINTKGSGNIELNASTGNIYTNSDSIHISGYIKTSIYKTSTNINYIPDTTWNIPINTDTIIFDFKNNTTTSTYYANVSAGIDGQKLNLIYNNKSSNIIIVLADFGINGLISGSGYNTGISFNSTGQSVALIYLGDDINAWQILNIGADIF